MAAAAGHSPKALTRDRPGADSEHPQFGQSVREGGGGGHPSKEEKKNSSTLRHPRGHRDDDPHAFRPPNPVPGTHTHTHAHGTRFRAIPGNVLIRIFRPDHSFNSRFAFATFVRHSSQMPNFCSIWLKFQNRESGRAGDPKAAGRSLFCGGRRWKNQIRREEFLSRSAHG